MSTGYLTRILKGQVELRMRHVLGVCEVIGLAPGNFFAALFRPSPARSAEEARLTRGLGAFHANGEHPAHSRDPETLLRELRGYLAELQEIVESESS